MNIYETEELQDRIDFLTEQNKRLVEALDRLVFEMSGRYLTALDSDLDVTDIVGDLLAEVKGGE